MTKEYYEKNVEVFMYGNLWEDKIRIDKAIAERDRLRNEAAKMAYQRSFQEIEKRFIDSQRLLLKKDSGESQKIIGAYQIAPFYRYGRVVNNAFDMARRLYEFAANKKHAGACYELACLYWKWDAGFAISKNPEKVKQYIELGLQGKNLMDYETDTFKQAEYIDRLSSLARVVGQYEQIDQTGDRNQSGTTFRL